MIAYVARRTVYMLVILFLSSIAIFYSLRFAPGEPSGIALNPLAAKQAREAYRKEVGLDKPLYRQYLTYVGNLVQGKLGSSIINGTPISEELKSYGGRTLYLDAVALGLTYLLAIPLGIIAAVKRNRWPDQAVMGTSILGMAIPNFWLALLLIWLFSYKLNWLPSAGCCGVSYVIMPAVVLAAEGAAVTMRMVRGSMLEQSNQDFVRTLRAKGLPERRVMGQHVFRNALIPVIALAGLRVGQLIGYTLIVETIFRWPGIGYLLVDAVLRRDYPVVQICSLVLVFSVVLANWLADLGSGWANPRIRRA